MIRTARLREKMEEQLLDAFVVTMPSNRRYLSGFTGSSGALVVTAIHQFLLTDFRYVVQARSQSPGWTLREQKGSLATNVAELLNELDPERIGFEADHLTVSVYTEMRSETPHDTTWVSTEKLIQRLRAPKDPDEIALIREAQRITDEAAGMLPALIQPGRSERAVAWALEQRLRDLGADDTAFEIIVASGPNSARPHHRPGPREIRADEVVLVDFGAVVQGYHSDMTRTWFTGEPSEQYRKIYTMVHEALSLTERTIHAGMNQREADKQARDLFGDAYAEYFGHALGHGVGLDVHESPTLSSRAPEDATVPVGSVVTAEPGLYLPEWGGVRLENLVYVSVDGGEVLPTTPLGVDLWRSAQ